MAMGRDAHRPSRSRSAYPGWYSGRTPHIHLRVRLYNFNTGVVTYNFVTQFFFKDTVSNSIYSSIYPYTLHPDRDTLTPPTRSTPGLRRTAR